MKGPLPNTAACLSENFSFIIIAMIGENIQFKQSHHAVGGCVVSFETNISSEHLPNSAVTLSAL